MFEIDKIKNTEYFSLIQKMQLKDKQLLEDSKTNQDSVLFSFKDEIPKITYILIEPKTSFATPIKYFQDLYINNEKWPFIWRHGSTRALGFDQSNIYLLSKHLYADEKYFSHYLFLRFDKHEIIKKIDESNSLQFSFNGKKEVYNLKTEILETIQIQFNFIQKPFHKTQKQRAQNTTMYKNTYRGENISQAASKFEDYVVTVPHFSPHPYLLNEFKKLGFEKRSDMQKAVFDYLKEKI